MKTATMTIGNPTTRPARPRRSLEELMDRLMATLTFPDDPEPDAVADTHRDQDRQPRGRLEELVSRLMETLTFTDDPEPEAVVDTRRDVASQPRGRLEELVDRLMETLTFRVEPEQAPVAASPGLVRDIHQARRHRQEGNLDGALQSLACTVPKSASPQTARWAFTEWRQVVGRRFGRRDPLVYSQETGRAAALVPAGLGGTLEVVAVLGMAWRPDKLVSRRSLRGLRPLSQGGA